MVLALTRGSPPGGGAAGPHTHPESDIEPDSILARVADPETWDSLQTLNAGLRLAGGSIEDSGGTSRIGLATTSPHITLTGDTQVSGNFAAGTGAVDSAIIGNLYRSGITTGYMALHAGMNVTTSPGTATIIGVGGHAVAPSTAIDIDNVFGLDYVARCDVTATNVAGIRLQTMTISISAPTITNMRHAWLRNPVIVFGTATNVVGLYVENFTAGTNRYAIECLGPSTTLFRVLSGTDPGANQTNLFLAENTGGTITLRRVQWKDGASITSGDKVLVLV